MEIAIWFQVAKQKERKKERKCIQSTILLEASISILVSQSMDLVAQNVAFGFLPRDVENTPSYSNQFRCYSKPSYHKIT